MDLWHSAEDLKKLDAVRADGPVVLVPTMGALHEGHLDLVRAGKKLGSVVVSIFVNPTQFAPNEDFDSYPRTLAHDLELLDSLDVAGVFAPSVAEVYGPHQEVVVMPGHRAQGLCGGDRPGHFAGVLTVVAKLFGFVRPDVAVFGRKDAQQCLVIGQMVEDLKMPIRLVDVPTRREADGLAMSSRNRYLSAEEHQRALCLQRALQSGRRLLERGCRSRQEILATLQENLKDADQVEYAEMRQVPDLEIEPTVAGRILLAVAARVGPARLIDNLVLRVDDKTKTEKNVTDDCLLGTGSEI